MRAFPACAPHANSAREALVKMCTLPLLAGENISARFVVPTVAASVDIVVHLAVGIDGRRRVREIVAVSGRVEDDVIETEPIFHSPAGRLVRAQGSPTRPERFAVAGIDIHELLAAAPDLDLTGSGRSGTDRDLVKIADHSARHKERR